MSLVSLFLNNFMEDTSSSVWIVGLDCVRHESGWVCFEERKDEDREKDISRDQVTMSMEEWLREKHWARLMVDG